MTIHTIADARAAMFAIHAERRRISPWATVQTFQRQLEDMIATEPRVVDDELLRISRATELDDVPRKPCQPDAAHDLESEVRRILENE